MSNPYEILQLKELESDEKVITGSYKDLALIWHPDKNKSKEAPEMFHKIKVAGDILMNPEEKKVLDNIITAGMNEQTGFQGSGDDRKRFIEDLLREEKEYFESYLLKTKEENKDDDLSEFERIGREIRKEEGEYEISS